MASWTTAVSSARYPLTTTFTPPSYCLTPNVRDCADSTACSATVFPDHICIRDSSGSESTVGCYPDSYALDSAASTASFPQLTYSPGRVCPVGMTTAASGVSPHGVWCCPTGLTWAAAASACTGTITEGVFMSSPAHCSESYDVYTFGPGSSRNTQGFVTEYTTPGTGTPSAATLQPASDIALTVQASGVFLQGQTMPTPTPSSAVDLSMEEVIHNQATVIHHPELVRRATPTTYPTIAPVSPGAIGGAIAGGVLGTAVLVGFGFIIRKKTRERVRAAREAAAAEAAKTGSTNGNANGSASANGSRRNSRTRIRASIRTIKTTPTPTITITEDDQPQQQQETQQMQTQYLYPDLESGDESAGSGTVTPKSEKDGLGGGGGGGVGVGERGGVPGAYVRRKAELEARLGVIPELEALPWSAMREEAITHSLPPSPGPSGRPRPTRRITG